MRINHDDKAIAFVCVFVIPLALATVSCTKDLAGSASTTTDDNGSVTTASSASAPPPSSATAAAATALPMPVAQAVPAVEFPAPAMTPPVMQAVTATQAKLDGLTGGVAGTRVRFVDCSEAASCTARVEAQSLAGLRDLLQSVSGQQGGIGFVVREQLDAYAGRTFVADVALGGTTQRAVPADENALLDN